jgi:hypothetical protein
VWGFKVEKSFKVPKPKGGVETKEKKNKAARQQLKQQQIICTKHQSHTAIQQHSNHTSWGLRKKLKKMMIFDLT